MPRIKRDKNKSFRIWYNKKVDDFMIFTPNSPDAHMANDVLKYARGIGGRTFLEELAARGYDITTLRISVWRKDSVIP